MLGKVRRTWENLVPMQQKHIITQSWIYPSLSINKLHIFVNISIRQNSDKMQRLCNELKDPNSYDSVQLLNSFPTSSALVVFLSSVSQCLVSFTRGKWPPGVERTHLGHEINLYWNLLYNPSDEPLTLSTRTPLEAALNCGEHTDCAYYWLTESQWVCLDSRKGGWKSHIVHCSTL